MSGWPVNIDAVEVEGFALEPVGAGKHLDDRLNRRGFVGLDLHADTHVVLRRKQVIDDVETLFAARPVDRRDVDDVPEQATRIVAQKAHHRHDVARLGVHRQFVMRDRIALDGRRERVSDRPAERVECLIHVQRSIVEVRRIFFCSRSTPYSSASAVGGQPGT